MTSDVTENYRAAGRAGVLAQLVVCIDIIRCGLFLVIAAVANSGIVMICYFIVAITGSRTVAGVMIALVLPFLILFVAAAIRAFYCFLHPYLSPRWLAAARATFGDDIITPVVARLRVCLSPDHILRRSDLIDAIIAHRRQLNQTCTAARAMRMRDIAGQG